MKIVLVRRTKKLSAFSDDESQKTLEEKEIPTDVIEGNSGDLQSERKLLDEFAASQQWAREGSDSGIDVRPNG